MSEHFKKIQEYIQNVKETLSNKPDAELLQETYISIEGNIRILDALITVNKKALAVFEFKDIPSSLLTNQQAISIAEDLKVDCRYTVISNGLISKVIDTFSTKFQTCKSVEELIKYLFNVIDEEQIFTYKMNIHFQLKEELNAFKKDINSLYEKHKTSKNFNIIGKIEQVSEMLLDDDFYDNLIYDEDGQFFHLASDIRDFTSYENRLFKTFVEDLTVGTKIHRYTTLDSVCRTIEGGQIRLGGLVGMNDISEVGYVESYLDKKFVPMTTDQHIDSVNRKFIMCSSILEDELMQWRTYGDDCKGGCLTFEVINNNELPGLLLRKISYGINIDGNNYHPELELLFRIQRRIKNTLKIELKFRTLEIWKHFFKSFEYAPEKEVRLLLIGNTEDQIKGEKHLTGVGNPIDIKWNLTNSHQILAPFILLDLNDTRLRCKLSKTLLGAKCPEIGINLKQFKHLSFKRGLTDLLVEPSKIQNYR